MANLQEHNNTLVEQEGQGTFFWTKTFVALNLRAENVLTGLDGSLARTMSLSGNKNAQEPFFQHVKSSCFDLSFDFSPSHPSPPISSNLPKGPVKVCSAFPDLLIICGILTLA